MLLASAIGVVLFRNVLYSALCLIINLLVVAALFATLGAHFLATVQIIVYAGAIMVLVVFLIMLLNLKVENPKKFGLIYSFMTLITAGAFLWCVIPLIHGAFKVFPENNIPVQGTVKAIGQVLYRDYIYPFEATSLLILAAIVGAVMLAKRDLRRSNR